MLVLSTKISMEKVPWSHLKWHNYMNIKYKAKNFSRKLGGTIFYHYGILLCLCCQKINAKIRIDPFFTITGVIHKNSRYHHFWELSMEHLILILEWLIHFNIFTVMKSAMIHHNWLFKNMFKYSEFSTANFWWIDTTIIKLIKLTFWKMISSIKYNWTLYIFIIIFHITMYINVLSFVVLSTY